jgi:hypothetical protein
MRRRVTEHQAVYIFTSLILSQRLDIGVVGNVRHDRRGVRAESGLELGDPVEVEVTHGDISRRGALGAAGYPLLHGYLLHASPSFCCTMGMCLVQ